jgi:hypothetical protein
MRLAQRSFVGLAAALGVALAASLHAQDKAPAPAAAKEAPKQEAQKPEAQKPEAKKAEAKKPAKAMSKERLSRRQQDARHCLEQPNNTAIIKCAEAYL